jgi:Flp pilus assembly protein TadG
MMSRFAQHGADRDRGVAALETALFVGLLMGVLALIAPLGNALLSKSRLERVADEAARFGAQYPGHSRPGTSTRRPSGIEICAQVRSEAASAGLASSAADAANASSKHYVACSVTDTTTSGAATDITNSSVTSRAVGDVITVHITYTQDLSAFGGILRVAGAGTGNINLAATAYARQE